MTRTLEQLGRQHATLGSIGGIVRTMKTLSAINAIPYEQAADAISAWQQTLEKAFAAFAFCTQGRYAAVPHNVSAQTGLLLVFGSDHGLCGNYHDQLADLAFSVHQASPADATQILCVGGRLYQALDARQLQRLELLTPPASVAGIGRLASQLVQRIEHFSRGSELGRVHVRLIFMQRSPHGAARPLVDTLLPMSPELFRAPTRWPSASLPMFTMAEEKLLSSLLRNYLFARLYRASAEAMVTENAARLALMQQAERSVSERLEALAGEINQVRQDDITAEIMDIVMAHLAESEKTIPPVV